HLLQAALVKVLGDEVHQAGSQVEENGMRFDFTYSKAMTPDEISKTENIVNNWISKGLPVVTEEMDIEKAKLTGATALFGEKYEDVVRVVSMGEGQNCISKEFCAGTHARNTRDLRLFKIVSEGAIAAGTRRIESVVSDAAFEFMNAKVKELDKLSLIFKAHSDEVVARVEKLQDENKELNKQVEKLKEENSRAKFATFLSKAQDIKGGKLFISKVEDLAPDMLKTGVEFLAQKLGESIIILANNRTVISKVSDEFIKQGIQAGKLVSDIAKATGANGGGRPNFAQGGIKDSSKLNEILKSVEESIINN
ncbi:alanine--tRNA ligase, partial [bacterium]|nr:alanine--tRNA ligase [bacterium]